MILSALDHLQMQKLLLLLCWFTFEIKLTASLQIYCLSVPDKLGSAPRRGIAGMLQLGKCDLEGKFPKVS